MAGELGFKPEEPHIEEVYGPSRINKKEQGEKESSKKRDHSQQRARKFPAEYLNVIEKAAVASNAQLEKKGVPYRFKVSAENGEVVIDLVLLDGSGTVIRKVRRDITHEDFNRVIEDISAIEGLCIDTSG